MYQFARACFSLLRDQVPPGVVCQTGGLDMFVLRPIGLYVSTSIFFLKHSLENLYSISRVITMGIDTIVRPTMALKFYNL